MPRPKQRTPELAERILASAMDLIEERGVEALTARGLAERAGTSPAAVYELFGDKGGVVRAIFFAGFRCLADELGSAPLPEDPLAGLEELAVRYRRFLLEHPALSAVMFSRPFTSFDPVPEESAAGAAVRERIVGAVEAAVERGALTGGPWDISHAYVALIQGLAAAELAERLGGSPESVERRWRSGVAALLRGYSPA